MGILIGILIGKNHDVEVWERYLAYAAFIVGTILVLFSLTWSLHSWPPMDIWEEVPWCWARQILLPSGPACVRCGDQECIDRWRSSSYALLPVSVDACRESGWIE